MTESTAVKEGEGSQPSSAPAPATDAAEEVPVSTASAATTASSKVEPAADDRPPLIPVAPTEAVAEKKEKENEEKDRRLREGDDRDRQGREIRAGLHPLQVPPFPILHSDNLERIFPAFLNFDIVYLHSRVQTFVQKLTFRHGISPCVKFTCFWSKRKF